jgi:hypothetical protein
MTAHSIETLLFGRGFMRVQIACQNGFGIHDDLPPTRQLDAQGYQRYIAAGNTPFEQVKPILDSRCVACHACYDAPCQLQMGSGAGIERGASNVLVYDATRFHPAAPTRLFIDASTTATASGRRATART